MPLLWLPLLLKRGCTVTVILLSFLHVFISIESSLIFGKGCGFGKAHRTFLFLMLKLYFPAHSVRTAGFVLTAQ